MARRPPSRRPTGRVTFASIEALTLAATENPQEQLEKGLRAGTRIERHGRVWRMGQWSWEGESIVGRIGFESVGLTELWDDEANDFRESERPLGLTSPFAINPEEMRIAFQLRGGEIKAKSFTAAFQALLNAASPTDRWRVHREFAPMPFQEWVNSVDRVILLRLVVERPNPHYGGRDRVRQLVEGTNARLAEISLKADPDDPQGLDIDDPLVQQAIDHVSAEYGSFSAVAERGPEQASWTSAHEGAAEVRRAATDPKTHEVTPSALRRELGDRTVDEEEIEEGRAMLEGELHEDDDPEDLLEDVEDE